MVDNQESRDIAVDKVDKPTRLDEWKDAIRLGIRYRRVFGRSRMWSTYKQYYRGFFKEGTVPVNIIYAIGRSMIPQLYFRNPRFSVIGAKPGLWLHAAMMERLDNYLMGEMELKQTLKSACLNAYLCGVAPIISGFDSEFGYDKAFEAGETFADSTLSQFNEKGLKIEYNYAVKPGMPWALCANPVDFVLPWGCKNISEAPWFAFRKMRPKQDIMEDPKYINKEDLKAPYKSNLEGGDTPKNVLSEDFKQDWVEFYQVHDQRSGLVMGISLDHDKFLREDFDELQIEGLPADVLGFNEDPDYAWWTPDCRLIEQQQLEINDIRTMAKYHRRVALLKVLYDKQMVTKEELTKLLDGDPKAAVAIDAGASGDIRKAVAMFQSHVPPDLISAAREVREDIREIIGFSRNQMGSFEDSSGRRTAYEAEVVRAASMIRIDERRDILADMLVKIMRRTNQIIFKNWNDQKIIDIVGPDGARYWIRYTGRELRGEFNFKLNPEETMPSSQGTRRADAQQWLELALKVPGMNVQYLMKEYGRTFDWIDPQQLFPADQPGRNPEQAMPFNVAMQKFGATPQTPMAEGLGGANEQG